MINTTLGQRYRITEKVGTGGMADVYKAVDEVLGRSVAVKVMHAKYASDANFAARFRQEAQAAANLQSPYIVNIYDWGQDDETYYIVMEYVRGQDLKSIIQQQGALPSKKVADIGQQVCAALAVAHGYDVIHRDIKPHNIMVKPDGSVKVMDFGIARAGNTTMTQTGSVLGTAHYVSPEQAQGKELSPASDLYSLGIVLYEASCGQLPFDAETPVAVALKQVNEQPVRPSKINPSLDPGLEAVIGRALAKDPRARYATAEDMRRDLQNVARGVATGAGMRGSNDPTLLAAPVMAGAASDATTVMPSVGTQRYGQPNVANLQNDRNDMANKRNNKKSTWWIWAIVAVLIIAAGIGIAFGLGLLGGNSKAVPDVVGKTLEQATSEIEAAGFTVGEVKEQNDSSVPAGSVIDQSPTANAQAESGTTINLTISLGAAEVDVPDIVGMSEADAKAALEQAGFIADPQPAEYDTKIESGLIISQTPEAGSKLAQGSKVSYIPSKGVEIAEVPDVVGMSKSSAKSTLEDAGFKVSTKSSYSDTVAQGEVISQNPSSGIKVSKGSKVTITVSKGEEVVMVSVPDVVGLTQTAAKSTLTNLGLKVNITYEPHSQNNVVLEQDPQDGASVQKGTTINLIVDAKK